MDGLPVHSFQGLLSELANLARVTYALKPGKSEEKTILTFRQLTEPTPVQARAYELVRTFPVSGKLTLCFPLRISQDTRWDFMEHRFSRAPLAADRLSDIILPQIGFGDSPKHGGNVRNL